MQLVRFAGSAELTKLQLILQDFLVLGAEVIDILALRTFEFYHVILRHTMKISY